MGLHGPLRGQLYIFYLYWIWCYFPRCPEKRIYILCLSQTLNEHISGVLQLQLVHLFSMQHVTENAVTFHVHGADPKPHLMRSSNIWNFHRNSSGLSLGLQSYNIRTLSLVWTYYWEPCLFAVSQQHCSLCVLIPLTPHTSPVSKANNWLNQECRASGAQKRLALTCLRSCSRDLLTCVSNIIETCNTLTASYLKDLRKINGKQL
jgi:hypothetical protein